MSARVAAAGLLLSLCAGRPAAAQEGMPKPTAKEVVVETPDGLRLPADLYEPAGGGEGKPAVLALHAQGGDRKAWKAVGALLSDHGLSLLAPDLRGHGAARALKAEAEWPPADDPGLWKAMAADVEAGLKYLRGTLLADGKKIGIAGNGAGAGLAFLAAEKDGKVRAAFGVGPEPNACGLAGLAAAVRWDDRPAGFVVGREDAKGDAAALERELRKHPRTDVVVLALDKKTPPAGLLALERAAAETVQFFVGWFDRPPLPGKPEEGVHRGSGIFLEGHGSGAGNCAGGIKFEGYYAPGLVTAFIALADPDPAARKLTTSSRRITAVPARAGKAPALSLTVETWTGTGWKREKPFVLTEAGAFVVEEKTTFYQVWLSPAVLGVAPFSKLAVESAIVVDGTTKWSGESDAGGFPGGPRKKARAFTPTDPSAWQEWELR